MGVDSYNILGKLKRNLLLPYVLLILVAVAIDGVLFFSASRLNQFSRDSSTHLFESVLEHELQSLGRLTRDYSFWYETVEKLAINFDPVWVVSNLQIYLRENFNVSRVFVINPDGTLFLSIHDNNIQQGVSDYRFSAGLQAMFREAVQGDMLDPQPVVGRVLIEDEPYLAAVSSLTPDVVVRGLDAGKSYGLLVFAKPLADLLPGWSENYEFGPTILVNAPQVGNGNGVPVKIRSPVGETITVAVLHPIMPGDDFIEDVIPWVTLFVVLALILSLYFVIRVNLYSRAANRALSDLQDRENEFRLAQQKLSYVIDGAQLGYWDWNYLEDDLQVNDRWLNLLGITREEVHNHISDWFDRVHPRDIGALQDSININIMVGRKYKGDFRMRHKEGHWVWIQCAGAVVEYHEGAPSRLCGTFQDISDRKAFERWLKEQAIHDHLTGLLNRGEMERLFAKELDRARRYHHQLSVFMIDIDHFKRVNDDYGHQTGDRVLQVVAGVLSGSVRQIDIVARFGGEEFILVLPETAEQKAREMAERLRSEIADTVIKDGDVSLRITVSVGISTYPDSGQSFDALLSRADAALYEAKHRGRNRVIHVRDYFHE